VKKLGKVLLGETHRRATEHHLPYGIISCSLAPNTGESALPQPQPNRLVPKTA